MGTVSEWIGLIGGIAGIIILLTGAFVFVKGSYSKAKIEALRQDNSDLRDRVNDLEHEVAARRAKEEELEHKLIEATEKIDLLSEMVMQRANVEAIHDIVENHHIEAKTAWTQIQEYLRELKDQRTL